MHLWHFHVKWSINRLKKKKPTQVPIAPVGVIPAHITCGGLHSNSILKCWLSIVQNTFLSLVLPKIAQSLVASIFNQDAVVRKLLCSAWYASWPEYINVWRLCFDKFWQYYIKFKCLTPFHYAQQSCATGRPCCDGPLSNMSVYKGHITCKYTSYVNLMKIMVSFWAPSRLMIKWPMYKILPFTGENLKHHNIYTPRRAITCFAWCIY